MNLDILSAAIGTGAILVGLGALVFPRTASKFFGMAASGKAEGYVRGLGARDVFIGLALWLGYLRGDHLTLAILFSGIAFVSATDCWMVRTHGDKLISWTHLAGVFVGLGFFLLYLRA